MFHRDFTDFTNEIEAPVEEIFEFFKQIEKWPEWTSAIRKSRPVSPGDWRIGYQFSMNPGFAPFIPLRITIFEYEEHKRIGWGVRFPGLQVIHRFDFERLGANRTRVRNTEFADGLLAVFMTPLGGMIDSFDRKWANDMEARFRKRNAA